MRWGTGARPCPRHAAPDPDKAFHYRLFFVASHLGCGHGGVPFHAILTMPARQALGRARVHQDARHG
jgi:hypothetical protein